MYLSKGNGSLLPFFFGNAFLDTLFFPDLSLTSFLLATLNNNLIKRLNRLFNDGIKA